MKKEILLDSLTIACGVAFLYIFISIAVTGGYTAAEPNKVILSLEIIIPAMIFLLGVKRLIDDLRKWEEKLKMTCPHCGKQMLGSKEHKKSRISTRQSLESPTVRKLSSPPATLP